MLSLWHHLCGDLPHPLASWEIQGTKVTERVELPPPFPFRPAPPLSAQSHARVGSASWQYGLSIGFQPEGFWTAWELSIQHFTWAELIERPLLSSSIETQLSNQTIKPPASCHQPLSLPHTGSVPVSNLLRPHRPSSSPCHEGFSSPRPGFV